MESIPWYRQFWPWFLIALPATVVVAGLFGAGMVAWSYFLDGRVMDPPGSLIAMPAAVFGCISLAYAGIVRGEAPIRTKLFQALCLFVIPVSFAAGAWFATMFAVCIAAGVVVGLAFLGTVLDADDFDD